MNPLQETFSMSTIGINDPGTLKIQLTSIDRKSGESSFFQSVDLLLRPNDGLSMNLGNSTNNTSKPSISIAHKNGVMQEIQLAAASGAGFPSSANFIKPNLPLTANTRQPLSPVSGDMTDIDLPSNNNMPASMPSISMPSLPAS
jgi:hypothetical protein